MSREELYAEFLKSGESIGAAASRHTTEELMQICDELFGPGIVRKRNKIDYAYAIRQFLSDEVRTADLTKILRCR